jgi:hypothetical protein
MKIRFENILSNKRNSYIQRTPNPINVNFIKIDDLIIGEIKSIWMAYDRVCDHQESLYQY